MPHNAASLKPYLDIHPRIQHALANNIPVVALESTIISHGMPYPQNVETAVLVEQTIKDNGAEPATIAIINGRLTVGLDQQQITHLGKSGFDVIKTVEILEERLAHIRTPMSLSIIGCVVNGPGEALMTDIGFTGGGSGSGMVYNAGKRTHKMKNEDMIDDIVALVEKRSQELVLLDEA